MNFRNLGNTMAALLLVTCCLRSEARAEPPVKRIDFNRDIRPILSNNCYPCHGPDKNKRKADLRLDLKAGLYSEHDGDRPVVAGKPGESELYRRITAEKARERMPPPKSKLQLRESEIELIRAWIEQGAHWSGHWAFRSLEKTTVPALDDPASGRNAIDNFIQGRLRKEGLEPANEAGREKLIRRLSLDLTGLPPTLAQIDAFLEDNSPDAYDKLVDRLLSSPAHGERMASDWLDLARYSDTYGYQVDRDRFVWPWRDWVVKAFNAGIPYDEFITLQLAGDLLPNAGDEEILPTTFNRLHSQKVEGGSTPEEFRVEYVADRTHTFATAFLGLTLECARCHNHKYDPVTQEEYYKLFAFFNNIDEFGLYAYFTSSVPTPTLFYASDTHKRKIADAAEKVTRTEEELAELPASRKDDFEKWLGDRPAEAGIPGRIEHQDFDTHKGGANASVGGVVGKAIRLSGDDEYHLKQGNFRRSAPFSIALWMKTPEVKERAIVFHRSQAWTDAGSRGYQLLLENGKLSFSLIHFWPGNALRIRTRAPFEVNRWVHVGITYDGSSRADGTRLFLDGTPADCEIVRDNLYKNITGGGRNSITIGARFRDKGFAGGLVDEFQIFNRQLSSLEISQIHDGKSLLAALKQPRAALDANIIAQLREHYLHTADGSWKEGLKRLRSLREEHNKVVDGTTEIMVMKEKGKLRQTHLLVRGAYNKPGEPVEAGTPAILPAMKGTDDANRLGLVRWLTDPGHPLTSRVMVNRLWQMCFGRGLVRTTEDFGSQGESPSHPALLDWLSMSFIESGWDIRKLIKTIVTSATYRQDSVSSPALLEKDPENRLLGRGRRYRLPAEVIRDNALASSGLLVRKVGGAPVRPYEVTVSFKPMKRDKGEGLYRRSLYTFWKRTAPAPVMMALDASKREVCTVRRERTASPLQALVLMNDPQLVEAARILGQEMLKKHADNSAAMLDEMFRILTGRHPGKSEKDILARLHREQLEFFEANAENAKAFLKTGDAAADTNLAPARLAAAGAVANVLLNFDEAVMKR